MKSQLSLFFRAVLLVAVAAFPTMAVSGLPFGGGIADCSSESAFAVVGREGESQIVETARALDAKIAEREGRECRPVEPLALPADEAAARQKLLDYAARVCKDNGVKRVGALVTPVVYAVVTNVFAYNFRLPDEARKSPFGTSRHADMMEFPAGGEITEVVMDFVCGYRIDLDNPVCAFESGEPPMTAAEAVEAMDAGDWIEDEMAKARSRLAAWRGNDDVVLVAFETDLHVYSPVRGRWKDRAALIEEGNFRHVKRFARVANAFGVDLATDLGDLGYDYSGRHWKHACMGERAARMMLQRAAYDLVKVPFLAVQGNHDGHWNALRDFGDFFNPPTAKRTRGFVLGPTRSYGYYDLPEKRTRLFFLNTSEVGTGGGWAMGEPQVEFIGKAVDATPDGWTVAFFSHDCLHPAAGYKDRKTKRPDIKQSKTYRGMRSLMEAIAAGGRLKLSGIYCGDSHFNRLHEENGVRYFICDAAFKGRGERRMLVHLAAIKPRTGEARLFRIGVGGEEGDL